MADRRAVLALIAVAGTTAWCSRPDFSKPEDPRDEPPADTPADRDAVRRFKEWQAANALPAVFLEPVGPALSTPGGSRIGGPAWLPAGEAWPTDAKGGRMTFLGQVDFARLPALDDYPEAGVLQFFIGRDIYFGADFNRPESGQFKVFWRPDLNGPGAMQSGNSNGANGVDHYSPIEGKTVTSGFELVGKSGEHAPSINDWRFRRDLKDIAEGRGRGGVNRLVNAQFTERPERHHIGGNPDFVQDDWRGTPRYQDYDRVLLNLWSDRTIMWGDMGQGQFLIRRADLLALDFSRVAYQWDSG